MTTKEIIKEAVAELNRDMKLTREKGVYTLYYHGKTYIFHFIESAFSFMEALKKKHDK